MQPMAAGPKCMMHGSLNEGLFIFYVSRERGRISIGSVGILIGFIGILIGFVGTLN